MAFEVYWDSRDQRRLVLELDQTVTWEEFMDGVREAHALAVVAHQPVALVIWAKSPFPEGQALWRLNSVFRTQPQNIERTIIVPAENSAVLAFAKILAGVIRGVCPAKPPVLFAASLEEARALSVPADARTS